jgi:hypothetical protein
MSIDPMVERAAKVRADQSMPAGKITLGDAVSSKEDAENLFESWKDINKFAGADGTEYYIRFTSQVENVSRKRPNKLPRHELHSTAISESSIYKAADVPTQAGHSSPVEGKPTAFVDQALQEFFDSVKPGFADSETSLPTSSIGSPEGEMTRKRTEPSPAPRNASAGIPESAP